MIEKVACRSEGCKAMILPITAESTGGICMPCKQKAEQAAREEHIRRNRRTVDPFAGVTDPVEIVKIRHQPRQHNPLIVYLPHPTPPAELYGRMTATEIARVIRHVLDSHTPEADDPALEIGKELAALTDANLAPIQAALLEAGEYYPGYLFRGAPPDIARRLIGRLDSHAWLRNHILQALAWAGTDDVVALFAEWRAQPPEWRSELYIPPEDYAHCAGWELDADGGARKLVLGACYALIARKEGTEPGPVATCRDLDEACRWCGLPLTALFTFDLSHERLAFIPFRGRRLTIATCQLCAAFGQRLYMHAGPDGEAHWHVGSQRPDYLPEDSATWGRLPADRLRLSAEPRLPQHAVDWCLYPQCSQVGGLPSWIQDTAYNRCPECSKGFVFVAQLAVEDVDAWGEGIYYALMCPDCAITTVRYQQT